MNQETFLQAVTTGDLSSVKSLLDNDPQLASAKNPQGQSALLLAAYNGRKEIRDLLLSQGRPLELPEAAAMGDLARTRELVAGNSAAANTISPDGFPIVALAAFLGHYDVVEYLVSSGADVNAIATNGSAYTALTAAVTMGHERITAFLIDHDANVNYVYSKQNYTPLLAAAANGSLPVTKLLLHHGADRSVRTADGKSPADIARERNHPDLAAFLA